MRNARDLEHWWSQSRTQSLLTSYSACSTKRRLWKGPILRSRVRDCDEADRTLLRICLQLCSTKFFFFFYYVLRFVCPSAKETLSWRGLRTTALSPAGGLGARSNSVKNQDHSYPGSERPPSRWFRTSNVWKRPSTLTTVVPRFVQASKSNRAVPVLVMSGARWWFTARSRDAG